MLTSVREILTQALQQWQTMDFRDVEIAITLTYMLAEALPVSLLELTVNDHVSYMTLRTRRRKLYSYELGSWEEMAVSYNWLINPFRLGICRI